MWGGPGGGVGQKIELVGVWVSWVKNIPGQVHTIMIELFYRMIRDLIFFPSSNARCKVLRLTVQRAGNNYLCQLNLHLR